MEINKSLIELKLLKAEIIAVGILLVIDIKILQVVRNYLRE